MKQFFVFFFALILLLGFAASFLQITEPVSDGSAAATTTTNVPTNGSSTTQNQPNGGGNAPEPVAYQLSGVYGFRDDISYGTLADDELGRCYYALSFSLFDEPNAVYTVLGMGVSGSIYYGNEGPGDEVYSPSLGWVDSKYVFIDLGKEPQTVEPDFYNWFIGVTRKFGN